jgi:uncharacterized protein (TIGR02145 family)
MKKGILALGALAIVVSLTSTITTNSVVGKDSETIKIGQQVWMTKNLDVTTYRNGDAIPEVKSPEEWSKLKTGAWCYYYNKEENGEKYGKLYNWYAVNDPRGLAPAGYHIPSDKEWQQMCAELENEEVAAKIKSKKGWKENRFVTNETGFSALPGGYRVFDGSFIHEGNNANFWSSTPSKGDKAWGRTLIYNHVDMGRDDGNMGSGLSVRCIED